jgi:hypothetical protein
MGRKSAQTLRFCPPMDAMPLFVRVAQTLVFRGMYTLWCSIDEPTSPMIVRKYCHTSMGYINDWRCFLGHSIGAKRTILKMWRSVLSSAQYPPWGGLARINGRIRWRPTSTSISTGRCNTSLESFGRCFQAQPLPAFMLVPFLD